MGKHSRSGGAIAGNVGGLGSNFFHHLRTHVLELVFEFDFFATETPSFVTVGAPKDLSRTTLRPFGPRVTRARGAFTPPRSFWRAESPNFTSLRHG